MLTLEQKYNMEHAKKIAEGITTCVTSMTACTTSCTMKTALRMLTLEQKYSMSKHLGTGSYGLVRAAEHRKTGERVAIKKIKVLGSRSGDVHPAPIVRRLMHDTCDGFRIRAAPL